MLITGESGTGKELVARALHSEGTRAKLPFVAVNCGAIPEELMESELFGHKKGSFTGAVADKRGPVPRSRRRHAVPRRDRRAVARPPGQAVARAAGAQGQAGRRQPKSSRSTSAWSPRPTASSRPRSRRGAFRTDLYYRLNVIEVRIPPLRQRREDIPLLAEHFLRRFAAEHGRDRAARRRRRCASSRATTFRVTSASSRT